ncbi:hypothetical protein AB751O23_AA_00110 [Chlamydiales bacterium SCGC AB-751-O23]|jgi:FkbM family methyltransferase|nr:hypothetical protein AB751O23_AA_00110 [Chlamydiales bacterium SCGC AB-751-O23]
MVLIVCSPNVTPDNLSEFLSLDKMTQEEFFDSKLQNKTGRMTPERVMKDFRERCKGVGEKAVLKILEAVEGKKKRVQLLRDYKGRSKDLSSSYKFKGKRIRNESYQLLQELNKRPEFYLLHLAPTEKNLKNFKALDIKPLVLLDKGRAEFLAKTEKVNEAYLERQRLFNQGWVEASGKNLNVCELKLSQEKMSLVRHVFLKVLESYKLDPKKIDILPVTLHSYFGSNTQFGTDYGGYAIPNVKGLFNEDSIVYSGGIGEDMSFDVAIANKFGCRVHMFDPTPRSYTHFKSVVKYLNASKKGAVPTEEPVYMRSLANFMRQPSLFSFNRHGVSNINKKDVKFYAPKRSSHVSHSVVNLQKTKEFFTADLKNIKEVMRKNGHDHIDLLKVDIEGLECELLCNILTEGIFPKVVSVDFDSARYADLKHKVLDLIHLMKEHGYLVLGRKPQSWDLTFVRREVLPSK